MEFPDTIPQEHLIPSKNFNRRINYARRDGRVRPPKINEDLVDYDLNIAGFEPNIFLSDVIATRKGESRRHFLFATAKQLDILRRCKNIKMDATFKICKDPHKQLLTIHSTVRNYLHPEGKTVPLFYALMSGKRAIDYVEVLKELKKFLQQDGHDIMFEDVLMDYEKAMWNAIENVFGAHVKKRGCWFHYTQAIFRRVSELKLTKDYYKKDRIYKMVRRFMTLALMDEGSIPVLFEHYKECYRIETAQSAAVTDLFAYMEKQWISGKKFHPDQWCCYKRKTRTNNAVENWNGKIWKRAGERTLHIYQLSSLLLVDAEEAVRNLRRAGSDYIKPINRKTQKAIEKIYEEYDGGRGPLRSCDILNMLMEATKTDVNTAAPNCNRRPV